MSWILSIGERETGMVHAAELREATLRRTMAVEVSYDTLLETNIV